MATNRYLNNYNSASAQKMAENLTTEALRFYGHDIYYLPRNSINRDKIFNEYEYSEFNKYYEIEVYIKNINSFGGDGQFLSKFSIEVRDQITLTMSVRSFMEFIGEHENTVRPLEGDLLYLPVFGAVYEIRFVENADIFFQMGKVNTWDLTCEVFSYSNETFNTGLSFIDELYNKHDFTDLEEIETVEPFAQNADIQDESDPIMDWTEKNPFGDL